MAQVEVETTLGTVTLEVPDDATDEQINSFISQPETQTQIQQMLDTQGNQVVPETQTTVEKTVETPRGETTVEKEETLGKLPLSPVNQDLYPEFNLPPQQGVSAQPSDFQPPVAAQQQPEMFDVGQQDVTTPVMEEMAQEQLPPTIGTEQIGIQQPEFRTEDQIPIYNELIEGAPQSFSRFISGWGDVLTMTNQDFNDMIEGSAKGAKEIGLALATKGLESLGFDISSDDPKVKKTRADIANQITTGFKKAVTTDEGIRTVLRNPFQVAEVAFGPASLAKKVPSLFGKTTREMRKMTGVDAVMDKLSTIPAENAVGQVVKGRAQEFNKLAGESMGKWLRDKDISGTLSSMSQQALNRFQESKSKVDELLENIPGQYQTPNFETALSKIIRDESRTAKSQFGKKIPKELKAELKKWQDLLNKYNKGGVSASELNSIKRHVDANFNAFKSGKPELKNSLAAKQMGAVQNKLREDIENIAKKNGIDDLADRNKETQLYRLAGESLEKAAHGFKPITGVDAVLGSLTGVASGSLSAGLGVVAAKRAIQSPFINSKIARVVNKMTTAERRALSSGINTGNWSNMGRAQVTRLNKDLAELGVTLKVLSDAQGHADAAAKEIEDGRSGRFTPTVQ